METTIYYQKINKYAGGATPVSVEAFNKKFGQDFKGTDCIHVDSDGNMSIGEYIYFKKVKTFKKSIEHIFKEGNIEFGL